MVRPQKVRRVGFEPGVTYFKPRGVPLLELEEVELTLDELETLRLGSLLGLSQTEAAKKMGVHQSTFHRTEKSALKKVADALIGGKALKIRGGNYSFSGGGSQKYCICPSCKKSIPGERGVPCSGVSCPSCGDHMMRGAKDESSNKR